MRRLLFSLFLILALCSASALAEAPPKAFTGSWTVSFDMVNHTFSVPADTIRLTILNDGQVSSTDADLNGSLVYDAVESVYRLGSFKVTIDDLGTLYLLDDTVDPSRLLVCRSGYSTRFDLPRGETLATSGNWELRYIKRRTLWRDFPWVEVSHLDIEPLTLYLPAHADSAFIMNAVGKMLDSHAAEHNTIRTLARIAIKSAELINDGVIIASLEDGYGLELYEICLIRTEKPTVSQPVAAQARELMGLWLIQDITLSSRLTLPADTLREDYQLLIDEYGYVKLGDDFFRMTADASRTPKITLQSDKAQRAPLSFSVEADNILITDPASNAQLSFISYAEAYWQDLCGTWEIDCIQYENMGMKEFPDNLDFTLTLTEDYTATLSANNQSVAFQVLPGNDVEKYTLEGSTISYTLQYLPNDKTLLVFSGNNSEILTFTRLPID